MSEPAPRRGGLATVLAAAGGGVLLLAVGLMGKALGNLREAHTYRQRTGEGLLFANVVAAEIAAVILGTIAAICLYAGWIEAGRPARRAVVTAALGLAAFAVGAMAFSWWVEARGSACIGRCG